MKMMEGKMKREKIVSFLKRKSAFEVIFNALEMRIRNKKE